MKIEIDKEVDAAYIYLKDNIGDADVARTISINNDIVLDFDTGNKLVGIEVLNASKNLVKSPEKLAA